MPTKEPSQPKIQRQVTRACILCAQTLLQHGAESSAVEQLSTRLGLALGMDMVELSISSNSIVLTTIYQDHCLTTARKSEDAGINMYMLSEVHDIVKKTEDGLLTSEKVYEKLNSILPVRHPNWLVVLMAGIACACFCRMAGGSWGASLITLFAASLAMFIRQRLGIAKVHPMLNVSITAFFAIIAVGLTVQYITIATPKIAMASCILLLAPGVPLMNSVSDIFKGHVNTGIARWVIATTLILTTSIGIVLAMTVLGIEQW